MVSVVKNLIVRAGADFSALTQGLNQARQKVNQFSKTVRDQMKFKAQFDGNQATREMAKTANAAKKQAQTIKDELNDAFNPANIGLAAVGYGAFAFLQSSSREAMRLESAMAMVNQTLGESAYLFRQFVEESAQAFNLSKADAYDFGRTYSGLIKSFATDSVQLERYTEKLLTTTAIIASKTGRTVQDVAERIRSGMLGEADAVEDLQIQVKQTALEQTKAFKQLANGKAWSQLTFKVQQQIYYMAILEQATETYGNTLANTTANKLAQFQASLSNMRAEIGKSVNAMVSAWLPGLTAIIQKFTELTSGIYDFFYTLTSGRSSNIQATTNAMAAYGDNISSADDDLKNLTKTQNKFLAGFDEINSVPDKDGGIGSVFDKAKTKAQDAAKALENVNLDNGSTGSGLALKVKEFFSGFKLSSVPGMDIINIGKLLYDKLVSEETKTQISNGVKAIGDFLKRAFTDPSFIGSPLQAGIRYVLDFAKGLTDGTTLERVKQGSIKIFETIKESFGGLSNYFKMMFMGIGGALGLQEVTDKITSGAANAWSKVKNVFNDSKTGVVQFFKDTWAKISEALKTKELLDSIGTAATSLWGRIKTAFKDVKTWFELNVGNPIGSVIDSIKAKFAGGIGAGLKTLLNDFIKTVNAGLSDFNKFKNGNRFLKNIPDIPTIKEIPMATGGIVDRPTRALIGEAGPEMVMPLENTSFTDQVASALGSAVMNAMTAGNAMANGGGRGNDVVLKIDGNTIARVLNPYLNKESARIGGSMISIS